MLAYKFPIISKIQELLFAHMLASIIYDVLSLGLKSLDGFF